MERINETLNQRNPQFDNHLRPTSFEEFAGQRKVTDRLMLAVEAARQRQESLDHVLLLGPPGLGKTTLAFILGQAMGVNVKTTSGPVIDKPGKGSFYSTDLELMLRNKGIKTLIVTGVTTEVCVQTTVREANDRGFECIVLEDCVGSYFPDFQDAALRMIKAQGGIFGWVSHSKDVVPVLQSLEKVAA